MIQIFLKVNVHDTALKVKVFRTFRADCGNSGEGSKASGLVNNLCLRSRYFTATFEANVVVGSVRP